MAKTKILSSGGLAESVATTVKDRQGQIWSACLETFQVVNDWRSQCVGGIETALLLWECCCIPTPQSVAWGRHMDGDFCCISKNHESTKVVVPTAGLAGRTRGPTSLDYVGYSCSRNGSSRPN